MSLDRPGKLINFISWLIQEEFNRMISTSKNHCTRFLESLLDHKQGGGNKPNQAESQLQERLSSMETQYSKMEADYFKKIKELRNTLVERTKKQALLQNQIGNLKEQFKTHQQEIVKITEEIASQKVSSKDSKLPAKNNSPGLIRKSLQFEKKVDKPMSPNTSNKLPAGKTHKSQSEIANQSITNSQGNKKRYSPTNNMKALIHIFQPHKNHQVKHCHEAENSTYSIKKSNDKKNVELQTRRANQSPKANNGKSNPALREFLVNSLKNIEKDKVNAPNGSPKRAIRKSPAQPAKSDKKLLGGLKEQLMQAF